MTTPGAPGDHRLAAQQAMGAAESAEADHRQAQSPVGGDEPGVLLSDATPAELAALGMSPGVERPEHGPLQQAPLPADPPPVVAQSGVVRHPLPVAEQDTGGGQ